MRNSPRHSAGPVLLLVLSFVLLATNLVVCRPVQYSSEVEANPFKCTTNARVTNTRRLHTVRLPPLGYPPPPDVSEPPTSPVSPSPSPSSV